MRAYVFALLVVAAPALARKARPSSSSSAAASAPQTLGLFNYQFSQSERVEIAYGKTIVSVIGRGHTPWMGWFPLRVNVDNTQGPKQTVKTVFRTFAGAGGTSEVTRSVEVEAGQRMSFSMPVPSESRYGTVEVSSPVIGKQSNQVGFTSVYDQNRLVLTFGTPEEFEAFIHQKPDVTSGEDQVLPLPLEEAPVELASYMGLNAVFITDARGFEGLNEAQRRALEGWVAVGGTLVLGSLPRTKGVLPLLDPEAPSAPYGLGRIVVFGGDDSVSAIPEARLPVAPLGVQETSRRYPIPGTASYTALLPQALAPVGRFLFIITIFTLLIGPGSVWLARRRGPAILLASIPITAFTTCVVILGSSLLIDGFAVHGSSYGYTLLDRAHNRTITMGLTAWYANLAPRSASFDSNTVLIAPQRGGDATPIDVTWGDGARFRSGFIPSRTYREWGVVSVAPTRARLVVKSKGDGFVLQNGLGHHIGTVWLRMGDELLQARDVRDGGEVALKRGELVDESTLALLAEVRFVEAYWRPVVMAPVTDGQFLAVIDGPGFVPTGGVNMKLHEGKHVVRGEVER